MALWRAWPLGGCGAWGLAPSVTAEWPWEEAMAGRPPSVLPHCTGVLLRKLRSGGSWKGLQLTVYTPAENTAVCVQRGKWVMSSLP